MTYFSRLFLLFSTSIIGLIPCVPAQSTFPIINPTSNARVTLLEAPGDGLFSMNVELFWSFLPKDGDGIPPNLVLFFKPSEEMDLKSTPTITHCRINHEQVQCSEWDPTGRFIIPLPFPLYPGTRIQLTYHFSFEASTLPDHGIIDHFYPKVPAWHQGEWVIPDQYSAVFPYGTCHIVSSNPQANILISEINRRDAKQNAPPAINGCSIAFSNKILKTLMWHKVRIDYDAAFQENKVRTAMETLSRVVTPENLPHIMIIRGQNHAGWGICSAEDHDQLQIVLLEMILKMYYPLQGPGDLNLHADLTPFFLQKSSPLKWLKERNQLLSGVKIEKEISRLSFYMEHMPQAQRNRLLSRWIDEGMYHIQSIEDLLGLSSKGSNQEIEIQYTGITQGYEYDFNTSARLSSGLILKSMDGTFYLKNKRAQPKETFPSPLVEWYSGFSIHQQGELTLSTELKEHNRQSIKQRRKLWQSSKWQWFF